MDWRRSAQFLWLYLLFLILTATSSLGETLLHSISDVVGGGNYSFYHIRAEGRLRIALASTYGDADLYVSDKNSRPSFLDYELQSSSCGDESIDLPSLLKRPITVAVYGHPLYTESRYRLSAYFVADADETDYEYLDALYNGYDEESIKSQYSKAASSQTGQNTKETTSEFVEEEESTLWTIFVTIIKIIFDILL